jgi:hypothetical protein
VQLSARNRSAANESSLSSDFIFNSPVAGFDVRSNEAASNTEVVASFFQIQENLYSNKLASPLVGLVILDSADKTEIKFRDAEIMLVIPLLMPTDRPSCSFWSEPAQEWSTAGCTLVNATADALVCNCSHLTSFGCLYVEVTLPHWVDLTWENILDHPQGAIFLISLTLFFSILHYFASIHDKKLDHVGIYVTWKHLKNHRVGKLIYDRPKNFGKTVAEKRMQLAATDKPTCHTCCHWLIKRLRLLKAIILRQHAWMSIYGRNPCSTLSSTNRVWILYSALLTNASLSAFFNNEDDSFLMKLKVHIYAGAITFGIAFIEYRVFFRPRLNRFHRFFLDAAEEAYLRKDPKAILDAVALERSAIISKYFEHLGWTNCCSRAVLISLFNMRYMSDYFPVDFRLSRCRELRAGALFKVIFHYYYYYNFY